MVALDCVTTKYRNQSLDLALALFTTDCHLSYKLTFLIVINYCLISTVLVI